MDRYVIIIGAMKSGTTTLFDMLSRHPAIAPASNKEPGFFAFDDVWKRGFEWFHGLFDFDPAVHVYRLEASTDYTKAPFVTGVWERMTARDDVDLRLIYIMRHPLKRIESHARHVQTAGKEIGQTPSPRKDHGLDAGISPVSREISRYASQIDVYGEAWASGRLHLTTLEDLQQAPERTLAGIYRFLDLDPPEEVALTRRNAAGPRTRTHPVWDRLSRIEPLMALGRGLLPRAARDAIKSRFRKTVVAEGRFTLSDAETAELAAEYRADWARLRDVYGIDTRRIWSLSDE